MFPAVLPLLIEKGENQNLTSVRSDERLSDMYNGSTQMFLLAPYLQYCIALEGGADLGEFGEIKGRVGVLSLTLTCKLPMSSFLGQVTAADFNCHSGEKNWRKMTVNVYLTNGFYDTPGEGNYSKYKGVQNDREPRCLEETHHQDRKTERREEQSKYICTFCSLDLVLLKDFQTVAYV